MIALEMYTRLLTELHFAHRTRDTFHTRMRLQDVLDALLRQAAEEAGLTPQHIRASCERHAQACALKSGGRL